MSRPVFSPETLPELFDLLRAMPQARLMAGGTDLLVRLRHAPDDQNPLACLERIAGLGVIEEENGFIRLGAAASLAAIARHGLVRRRLPVLARAISELGSPPVRNMGTIGGNICTASPAGDTLPPLYALDALVELAGAAGARRLPLADFIRAPGKTALQPGELVTAALIPAQPAFDVNHFEKVGRRSALAVAVVSLAALVRFGSAGRVAGARIALGSVGPTVLRAGRAENALIGGKLTLAALRRAAALVREEVEPIDDIRASADYRREVAGNLLLRLAGLRG
jgi:xanthine dehydrogenase FAD-binding subunit